MVRDPFLGSWAESGIVFVYEELVHGFIRYAR